MFLFARHSEREKGLFNGQAIEGKTNHMKISKTGRALNIILFFFNLLIFIKILIVSAQ